jgi:hypothetical protein
LKHNWRNITPDGGVNDSKLLDGSKKTTVEAFYIRSVACWVPNLLIANHVPTCPYCKLKDHVDVVKARWINCPKILYGISSHKYLDTLLYPCIKCKKTFSGYHKQSLQLDANVILGYFNFFLGHGYAVDEPLFRMIVDDANTVATSVIFQKMKRHQHTEYLDQYQLYLQAVGNKTVKPTWKKQQTLTSMLPKPTGDAELDSLLKERNARQADVTKHRMLLNSARIKRQSDISFRSILKDKDNHNVHGHGNCIPGLGGTKLRNLIACNILSTKELLQADPVDYMVYRNVYHLISKWQRMVESYYKTLQVKVDVHQADYDASEAAYQEANDALIQYKNSDVARQ